MVKYNTGTIHLASFTEGTAFGLFLWDDGETFNASSYIITTYRQNATNAHLSTQVPVRNVPIPPVMAFDVSVANKSALKHRFFYRCSVATTNPTGPRWCLMAMQAVSTCSPRNTTRTPAVYASPSSIPSSGTRLTTPILSRGITSADLRSYTPPL